MVQFRFSHLPQHRSSVLLPLKLIIGAVLPARSCRDYGDSIRNSLNESPVCNRLRTF